MDCETNVGGGGSSAGPRIRKMEKNCFGKFKIARSRFLVNGPKVGELIFVKVEK